MTTTKLKVSRASAVAQDKPKASPPAIAILVLFGVLFPVLAIEAIAHLFPGLIPQEVKAVFQNEQEQTLKGLASDKMLGYKYAPGLVEFPVPFESDEAPNTYPVSTVSLGYANAGFRDDGLAGQPFAVVIGDSYASCASVEMEACWVELLEQETSHDFANLGVVGYAPQQEVGMLNHYGLPLHPKLVLWVFFPNDLNDAWRFDQFGNGAAREGRFWQNPVKAWLARHSAVYSLGAFFWYNRYLFYNLAQADGVTVPHDSNLVWWLTYTDLTIPEVTDGLTLTQQAILAARAQTLAEDSEARFVVVIFPYREQIYTPAALQPQLDHLNQALAGFCRQQRLACIDLTPALREKAKLETYLLYFKKDIHLNARGNQIAAELLTQGLKSYWP
ncbi:MAG: hypothetical protein HYR94_27860 [Chloroflexi bacterium]|nr:hypothetical protein [Chloroflexota bacterium]